MPTACPTMLASDHALTLPLILKVEGLAPGDINFSANGLIEVRIRDL